MRAAYPGVGRPVHGQASCGLCAARGGFLDGPPWSLRGGRPIPLKASQVIRESAGGGSAPWSQRPVVPAAPFRRAGLGMPEGEHSAGPHRTLRPAEAPPLGREGDGAGWAMSKASQRRKPPTEAREGPAGMGVVIGLQGIRETFQALE